MLVDKKEGLYKEIQDYFDRLLKRLRQQEKRLYMELEETVGSLEGSFRGDAERVEKKFAEFKGWERMALDYINVLEGEEMEKKLVVLDYYEGSKSRVDPIEEGYRIIDEAVRMKGETTARWKDVLEGWKMDWKIEEAEGFLKGFEIKSPLNINKVDK